METEMFDMAGLDQMDEFMSEYHEFRNSENIREDNRQQTTNKETKTKERKRKERKRKDDLIREAKEEAQETPLCIAVENPEKTKRKKKQTKQNVPLRHREVIKGSTLTNILIFGGVALTLLPSMSKDFMLFLQNMGGFCIPFGIIMKMMVMRAEDTDDLINDDPVREK